ncbi:hypothetical protein EMCG_08938 [[Emmonsia] crescens]|uniref:Aminoglycoside phosphotransferase domain-containing protein n=1 Tax=[Emmonsia] crescens TaxID=73230 RepID=A0A0G2J3R2_9EURO|nr:hypothetical protein EMCG_08938 [Emmonsia crescens UAMH 3008]
MPGGRCRRYSSEYQRGPNSSRTEMHVVHDDSDVISFGVESALREREKNRRCLSGQDKDLKPTFIVSPSIIDDEDLCLGGRLRPILDAVLSAEMTDKLFTFFGSEDSEKESQLKSLWLMSPGVRNAFQNGHIYLSNGVFVKDRPSIFPLLMRSSIRHHQLPTNAVFPFPQAFYYKYIPLYRLSCTLCLLKMRSAVDGLQLSQDGHSDSLEDISYAAVDYWDPQGNPSVKFLPFGLCFKSGRRVARNEANALRLIEKHASIAAPKYIDFAADSTANNGFLLMTIVPGIAADRVFYRMTYEERRQLAIDLGGYISQYRRIQNHSGRKHLICDTLGGPITDHRTDDRGLCGPYNSKTEFLNDLTEDLESIRTEIPLSYLYEKKHELCFTHSDLHLSNLLVRRGRLCGIIDWENAGFEPEFWEYARIVWGYKSNHRLARDFELSFEKSYK